MKTRARRNSILAGLGLLSLLVYVLACTSFSPDDSKVLFPAFDPASDGTSVMVYDRENDQTEQVFVRVNPSGPGETNQEPTLLRPEWLPDGKHILVANQGEGTDGDLELTVLPYGAREPVRLFRIAKSDVADGVLLLPLPILGSEAFLVSNHKGLMALDLTSGQVRAREFTNEFRLWEDPTGKTLFCWMESDDQAEGARFGTINPETLAFEPTMDIPEQTNMSDTATYACTPDGKRLVLLGESREKGKLELQVFRTGKLEFSCQIDTGAPEFKLGPASALSPKGDCLYASFMRADSGKTNCEYGLLEVPLSEAPPRWTTLIRSAEAGDDAGVFFFQGGLSHDGRTWAVASAYLWAQNQHVQDADCALFLVDLTDPQRKVTRVPIPVPSRREEFK